MLGIGRGTVLATMSLPLIIENDALRLEVYPQFGGKVLSIVDKADNYELLFDFPAEFPTACQYDRSYWMSYCAGWDECFPAIGPGPYPVHPYKGISVPDHGELWSLPTTAVPTKDGITTEWQGLRFGYRLSRDLRIEGPTLRADYTLQNFAPFDFYFVWAMHPLASLHVPVELAMPPGTFRLSHDADAQRVDSPFEWPVTSKNDNLSRPSDLPPKRGWKVFSVDPISAPAIVQYPSRRRCVKIEYSSEDGVQAYWGVWINTGGWAGHKHFAVELITGRFDEIDRSFRDSSAARIAPNGKLTWRVKWTCGSD
jgi:hypothetical protein